MLYNLIEIKSGKRTVVMTDSLPKINNRMKTLRDSHRKKKIKYHTEPADETAEKYKEKPHNLRLSGDCQPGPRKVKWDKKKKK